MAGGGVVARQSNGALYWRQVNPVTGDELETDAQRAVTAKVTLDPVGVALGNTNPFEEPAGGGEGEGPTQAQMNQRYAQLLPASMGGSARCLLDGMQVGCGLAMSLSEMGAASEALEYTIPVRRDRPRYLDPPLIPNGFPRPGTGGDTGLAHAFRGTDNRADLHELPGEWVDVRASLDEPIADPITLIGGGFFTSQALFWLQSQKPPKINKTISNAFTIARGIITGSNSCATWLGPNALQALNHLELQLKPGTIDGPSNTQTGIKMWGPQTVFGQPIQYRAFQNAVVNSSGPFMNMLSKTRIGGYSPARHQSQVLQILHELAHMVYLNGKPLIPDDVDPTDPDKTDNSESNTKIVLQNCKKEVDAVKN